MRRSRLLFVVIGVFVCATLVSMTPPAHAQNDWQYPDPYFGILEIEKSHDAGTARRYRSEVSPAPRSSRFAAPPAWQAPAGEAAGTATGAPGATPAPATRSRWRNRWRR
jgi:hypothetical protein